MKKKVGLFVISFSLLSSCFAQIKSQWTEVLQQTAVSYSIVETAVDALGNIYAIGEFKGHFINNNSIVLDSYGESDIFLSKYSPSGDLVWAKRMGSGDYDVTNYRPNEDVAVGIAISGNDIYVTGMFQGTINFNTPYATESNELVCVGGSDVFLAKFNTNGNFLWAKRAGGSSNWNNDCSKYYEYCLRHDKVASITCSGNTIYLTGSFYRDINFNTPSATGFNEIIVEGTGFDMFIAKFDNSGNFIWAKRAGGDSLYHEHGKDIFVTSNALYVLGIFDKEISFNTLINTPTHKLVTHLTTFIKDQIFVAKYDLNGNCLWSRRAGGNQNSLASNIVADENAVFLNFTTDEFAFASNTSPLNFSTPYTVGVNEIPTNDLDQMVVAKFDVNGTYQWAKRLGYTTNTHADSEKMYIPTYYETVSYSKLALRDSQLYISSPFAGKINFSNPYQANTSEIDLASSNTSEVFIAKVNYSNGNFEWTKRYGGGANNLSNTTVGLELISTISLNTNGQIILTGLFGGTVNFNNPYLVGSNELSSTKDGNIPFISQLNSAGELNWAKKYNDVFIKNAVPISNTDDQLVSSQKTAMDSDGNIYAIGSFVGSVFIKNPLGILESVGLKDIFLIKYNKKGDIVWARQAGGIGVDIGTDISILGNNIYITGNFSETASFGDLSNSTQLTSLGDNDIFVAKYNTNGDFIWAKRGGGIESDVSRGIVANSSGIYISGTFRSIADFNTPTSTTSNLLASAGASDIFIVKYNSSGTVLWLRRAGGLVDDYGKDIDSDGVNVYITGSFDNPVSNSYGSTINFNTPSNSSTNTINSINHKDGFVAKFSINGQFLWAKVFGGSDGNGFTDSRAVKVIGNSIYLGGDYTGGCSFDYGGAGQVTVIQTSTNYSEGFIAKYQDNGGLIWAKRVGGTVNDIGINTTDIYTTGNFSTQDIASDFYTPSTNGSGLHKLVSFATTSNSNGSLFTIAGNDIYIARFDLNGIINWVQKAGGTASDFGGSGLAVNGTQVILTGGVASHITGNMDFSYGDQQNIIHRATSSGLGFLTFFFDGSISTSSLSGSSFCASTSIPVSFSAMGTYDAANQFKVQISNSSGVFPDKIGNIGLGTSSPVSSTLPTSGSGSNYKIRVISTSPEIIGNSTPSFGGFTIIPASNGGTISGGTTVCTGSTTPIPITVSAYTGNILKWQQSSTIDFTSPLDINLTTATINVGNMTADRYFRAVVQNSNCPTANSIAASFIVSPTTLAGSLSSVNGIFCAGTNNNNINLSGKTGIVVKWQSSPNSSFTSPTDIANETTILNIENLSSSTFYRAVVKSGACAEVNTSVRQISVSSGAITFPTGFPLTNVTYPVKSNFTITGQNSVTGSSNVLYRSNKAVELKPGFRAENGVIFKAEIGGCN